jgi:hypothetical protein
MMHTLKRTSAIAAAAILSAAGLFIAAAPANADSTTPQGAGFGQLFYNGGTVRTVATPTSMPGRGVDTIYAFPGEKADGQLSVTAVAPGDHYHGGRWAVQLVSWNVAPYLLTSDEAVGAAVASGDIDVTRYPQADFVCPVTP